MWKVRVAHDGKRIPLEWAGLPGLLVERSDRLCRVRVTQGMMACCVTPLPPLRRGTGLLLPEARLRGRQHPAQLLPFFRKRPVYVGLCLYNKRKEQETFQTESPSISETTGLHFHVSEKEIFCLCLLSEIFQSYCDEGHRHTLLVRNYPGESFC